MRVLCVTWSYVSLDNSACQLNHVSLLVVCIGRKMLNIYQQVLKIGICSYYYGFLLRTGVENFPKYSRLMFCRYSYSFTGKRCLLLQEKNTCLYLRTEVHGVTSEVEMLMICVRKVPNSNLWSVHQIFFLKFFVNILCVWLAIFSTYLTSGRFYFFSHAFQIITHYHPII